MNVHLLCTLSTWRGDPHRLPPRLAARGAADRPGARPGGPAAVVLREAARQVQVSPTAAYRHFADKQALLLAVRREALGLLGERMLDTADRAGTDLGPLLHFRALGQGYVEFALAEPGLFRTLAAAGVVVQPGLAPEGHD
ncbi:MAG: TetR/AcrR family transcriptional regulator, partial [Actinomycetota bacterium]|nr:TetR/AcrR family transcriptional regulator [Actinomycetota bacterium]